MKDQRHLMERIYREIVASLVSSGIPRNEAIEAVDQMGERALELASKRTNTVFNEGTGDALLERESVDPSLHAAFQKRRAEGVTDEDIRWWWNMSAFEQEMLLQQDENNRMILYSYLRRKGMEPADAAKEVYKRHPKWGDPAGEKGDDRPLPCELKRRIVSYIERFYADRAELQKKIAHVSSFNALIRKEIKSRNL